MSKTQNTHSEKSLFVALELGNTEWKLAFSDGSRRRLTSMPARAQRVFWAEIEKAKQKFGLPAEAVVYTCYEAGRDGFWIDRMLTARGARNLVVDPSSIEVNRRARRSKTDRLDAGKLLGMLLRHWLQGERGLWSVIRVPRQEDEDARRIHRNAERLKKEQTAHRSRIRSLLALHGVVVRRLPEDFSEVKDWQGKPLPPGMVLELQQEAERLALVKQQLKTLAGARKVKQPAKAAEVWAAKLAGIKGVGAETAWNLGHEFFGWRDFRNRRQVGAAAGLTGSPYQSGESHHEQGISKAGNARVRHWMTELAWRWLRYQSNSELAKWYAKRFASGKARLRRIGIVALARKLLVAFWKYGAHGQWPEGAQPVAA